MSIFILNLAAATLVDLTRKRRVDREFAAKYHNGDAFANALGSGMQIAIRCRNSDRSEMPAPGDVFYTSDETLLFAQSR
jgi:hypothetical protein